MDDARPAGSSATYRCGAVAIDAPRRQVSIEGTPGKIGARAFDVLLALVERRERVVSKHELSRNVLLVLDSCEHLADDIAALVDVLRERGPRS